MTPDQEEFRQDLLDEAYQDAIHNYEMSNEANPLFFETVCKDTNLCEDLRTLKAYCKRYNRDFETELNKLVEYFND